MTIRPDARHYRTCKCFIDYPLVKAPNGVDKWGRAKNVTLDLPGEPGYATYCERCGRG